MERIIRALAILAMLALFIFAHAVMLICGDGPFCSGG